MSVTSKSPPRPWSLRKDYIARCASIDDADGFLIARNIDVGAAELIVAAVNAYDPERAAKMRALVEAAKGLLAREWEYAEQSGGVPPASIGAGMSLVRDALGETA